ncbi:STAS domain-containing protein [Qaidamihabitans albus]|uniref:STAS domain-containing protein n=1 Tax=Qaidamihabitans albus TaxID=2795733 RepID=UPI0018F1A24F|nr:STAS domain-containing protein [Qaidamihabitans albus]
MSDALCITRNTTGAAVVVAVSGDVDLTTAPRFEAALVAACDEAGTANTMIIDLTAVSFFGSVGMSLLIEGHERCRQHGLDLRVVADGRTVLRPLQLTGLDRVLDIVPAADGAFVPGNEDPVR